jgi:hypothetical protein
MPNYRVFVRDLDNHILSAGFTFICENDQEALAKTEKLVDGLDLELWCQEGRYVARIAAPGQSDKEPSQVVQADPAASLTRRKHVQIERDYIKCATPVVTRQSDNSQDCQSNPSDPLLHQLSLKQVHQLS